AHRPALGALGGALHRPMRRGVHRLDIALSAQSLAPAAVGSSPDLAAWLFLYQAVHQPGPFLAGGIAEPGPGRGLDRLAGRDRLAALAAGPGRTLLGLRVGHHLLLPGCRVRQRGWPEKRAQLARRARGSAPGGALSRHDDLIPGRAGTDLSAGQDLLRRYRRRGRAASLRARPG